MSRKTRKVFIWVQQKTILAPPKTSFQVSHGNTKQTTIYTYDGKDYTLEAELFSECISKQLENEDIDLLRQKIIGDTYKMKITNEALETHYINKFEVVVAEHPAGTELYPSVNGNLILVSKTNPPV